MLVFFTNLSLMEFEVRYLVLFRLFSVIDSLDWFWMRKYSKEYSVNAGVPQGSILGPTFLHDMLVFFRNVSLIEYEVRYLALFWFS